MRKLKMYIAVREEVPAHMVPVLVAHTVLNADTYFKDLNNWEDLTYYYNYIDWNNQSFKKCVIKVNSKEWNKINQIPKVYFGHENSVMDGNPSCAIPPIMYEYPNVINFARLWRPND